MQEERAARDALEAALAEAAEGRETALAELRARLEEQLAAEVEAHATTRTTLEGLRKQVATLNTAAEAARAQLQAHSISSQQRTAQFERQKADLEVIHPFKEPALTFDPALPLLCYRSRQLGLLQPPLPDSSRLPSQYHVWHAYSCFFANCSLRQLL